MERYPGQPENQLVLDAARREGRRATLELRLLSTIAPIGRYGLGIAGRCGVTIECFKFDDTYAIYSALVAADHAEFIQDRERTFLLVRRALLMLDLFDQHDPRSFIGPMIWSPGALARLFTGVDREDCERILPHAAADLLALDGRLRGAA